MPWRNTKRLLKTWKESKNLKNASPEKCENKDLEVVVDIIWAAECEVLWLWTAYNELPRYRAVILLPPSSFAEVVLGLLSSFLDIMIMNQWRKQWSGVSSMIFLVWTWVLLEILVYSMKWLSNAQMGSLFTFQGVDTIQAYIPDAVWYEYDTVCECRGYYEELFWAVVWWNKVASPEWTPQEGISETRDEGWWGQCMNNHHKKGHRGLDYSTGDGKRDWVETSAETVYEVKQHTIIITIHKRLHL